MSGAHPARSAVRKLALVGTIPAAIFVITLIRGLYPVGTRELWRDSVDSAFNIVFWLIDFLPLGAIILGVATFVVLGSLLLAVNWIRASLR